MKGYLIRRILFGLLSLIVVVGTVMILTYSLIDRNNIFNNDPSYSKVRLNTKTMYEYKKFKQYEYLEYTSCSNYVSNISGSTSQEFFDTVDEIDNGDLRGVFNENGTYTGSVASIQNFYSVFTKQGYYFRYIAPVRDSYGKIVTDGYAYLIAIKEKSVFERLGSYLSHLITFETVDDVQDTKFTAPRGIHLEWDKRSNMPALVGSGTKHKYLIYFDNKFPFVHQNFLHLNLGISTALYKDSEIFDVVTKNTGDTVVTQQQYPNQLESGGEYEPTSNDFHTASWTYGTLTDEDIYHYPDGYTSCLSSYSDLSMIANSFIIGIISTIIVYILGIPLGIWMAQKKDKLPDKIGNIYIVFIMAVPSLAYIFMFALIGMNLFGLPYKFATATVKVLAYILPIISLALPAMATMMKWVRRYMIDQKNSDYVKFARSQGLSENEIFNKHIWKNAFVFLVHSIPADILAALTGAIITERVYGVPGVGRILTEAISKYDNPIIVASTLFFTFLSILAVILGDLLLAKYDPRISLTKGGRK